ncbi:MAG TPA: hypothetical protein VN668_16385 [Stellaceae bacterium]|nr:hypothetical protein [Stellaceae bacterium]
MSANDLAVDEPLGMAEQHYRDAEARVAHQEALVSLLALHGHDISLSQALLETMRVTLDLMREHVEHARHRGEPASAMLASPAPLLEKRIGRL